jgi:hypothetical protein
MQLEFSRYDFRKILKYTILWNSIQWELNCSMWTKGRMDGRTDVTKLIALLRNFANVSTSQSHIGK